METRSSPSLSVLHCLAQTAGMHEFSMASKPELFHQLQDNYDIARLERRARSATKQDSRRGDRYTLTGATTQGLTSNKRRKHSIFEDSDSSSCIVPPTEFQMSPSHSQGKSKKKIKSKKKKKIESMEDTHAAATVKGGRSKTGPLPRPSYRAKSTSEASSLLPAMDPVMLTPLEPGTVRYHHTRPNGSVVVYGLASLVEYMISSGDFSEPETRLPFADEDLGAMDLLAAQHGLDISGSALEAKRDLRRYQDKHFKRDALTGLERLAGEALAEMVSTVESAAWETSPFAFHGWRGDAPLPSGSSNSSSSSSSGSGGGSSGSGGNDGNDGGSGIRHHQPLEVINPDEAQLRLALELFPAFADLYRQIAASDAAYARCCLSAFRAFVRGPPNRPTHDCAGLVPMVLGFLDEVEASSRIHGA